MAVPLLLLNPYVDAFLVLALGICIGGILSALTPYIAKIPWVGGQIANAVQGMTQAITHACGVILAPISAAVGGTFHAVARLIDWSYAEFRGHSRLLWLIAGLLSPLVAAVAAIRALVHRLDHAHTGQAARLRTLEKEWKGIEHGLKTIERELRGIDAPKIRTKLNHLGQEVADLEAQTIPAIKDAADGALSDVIALGGLFGLSFPLPRTSTLEKVGAGILTALGLNWLRCNSNPFNNNKNACGLWGDLANLLAIAAIPLEIASLEELIGVAQTVTEDVTKGVETLLQV